MQIVRASIEKRLKVLCFLYFFVFLQQIYKK